MPSKAEDFDYLVSQPWVRELMSTSGARPAAAAMSEPSLINGIDPDHLVRRRDVRWCKCILRRHSAGRLVPMPEMWSTMWKRKMQNVTK